VPKVFWMRKFLLSMLFVIRVEITKMAEFHVVQTYGRFFAASWTAPNTH